MLFITFWHVWLWNELRTTAACTFPHRNFQKGSDVEVLWAFSCRNLLWATTACNFSSLILPDDIASAALAGLYFWTLQRPNALEKHSVSRLFYHVHHFQYFQSCSSIFAHRDLLSSSFLFSGSSPSVAPSVHKSEVWLLNFLRLYHYVSYIYKQWIIFKAKAKELRRASPLWGRKSKELGSDETAEAAGNMVSRGAGHRSLQLIHHVPGALEPWGSPGSNPSDWLFGVTKSVTFLRGNIRDPMVKRRPSVVKSYLRSMLEKHDKQTVSIQNQQEKNTKKYRSFENW